MKVTVTHGQPDARGEYPLRAGRILLGTAYRANGGFSFIPTLKLDATLTVRRAPTMKALKAAIAAQKPEWLEQPKPTKTPTVDEARRQAGLSHNEVRWFLDEIRRFHPEMPRNHQGGYMMRRTFENIRDFPELARRFPWALRWLKENPTTGIYRPVSDAEWEAQARLP